MEDPSDDFQAMRDYVDCRNTLASEGLRFPMATGSTFGKEVMQACQKLKLSKVRKQGEGRRVWGTKGTLCS